MSTVTLSLVSLSLCYLVEVFPSGTKNLKLIIPKVVGIPQLGA